MISVSGFAIAIVLALFLLLSGFGRQAQTSEHHGIDEERIASMEQKQGEVRRKLEQLKNSIEMIENRLAQLGGQGEKVGAQAKETARSATPVEKAPDEKKAHRAGEEKTDTAKDAAGERVRQIVRDELERVEEERKQELAKQREAQKPEDWEKREFGNYAWNVHFMGLKLGLTDDQKRQYYTITKETAEQMKGLWQELKGQNPKSDSGQLSTIYQERIQEIQQSQRDTIMDILNEEQRKKYNEMYGGNQGIGKR